MKCNFLLRSNVPISPGKLISNRKVIAADTIHDSFMGDTLQIKNNLKGSGTEIERTRTSLRRNVLECGKYVFLYNTLRSRSITTSQNFSLFP